MEHADPRMIIYKAREAGLDSQRWPCAWIDLESRDALRVRVAPLGRSRR